MTKYSPKPARGDWANAFHIARQLDQVLPVRVLHEAFTYSDLEIGDEWAAYRFSVPMRPDDAAVICFHATAEMNPTDASDLWQMRFRVDGDLDITQKLRVANRESAETVFQSGYWVLENRNGRVPIDIYLTRELTTAMDIILKHLSVSAMVFKKR